MQTGRRAQQFSAGFQPTDRVRGRGRGRGRGNPFQQGSPTNTNNGPSTAGAPRGGSGRPFRGTRGTPRGRGSDRGRGSNTERFNSPDFQPHQQPGRPALPVLPIDPPQGQIKPVDHEVIEARRAKYEQYRQDAINRGLMSDDKQSTLDDAIKTVGTCTQMCDEKERVNRIFENQVDAAERLPCPETGRSVPIEGRMVKKFRRSAAGVDKQIPEELRTPRTLQKTIDYLFDEIIGKNRLGKHHKFVWDRTRAIRNDFSIQSLTKSEDIKYEVDCYERIVRFHILSAHQLSNPENLAHDEHFEHQQELEQLQKTFQSLMDKYDAFRGSVDFPNEAEFRAYYVVFSPILFSFDTEVQIQQWPKHILDDGRVQTALKLYAAVGNTHRSIGSKNLEPIPVAVAQANSGFFWALLTSQRVGYLMACVAEMSFQNVRFTALDALWRSAKGAPEKAQANMRTWTKAALTEYLCYDTEDETEALCERVDISFSTSSTGQEYLDFRSNSALRLENPFSKPEQVFCEEVVEAKRYGRTLVAVMNGMSIAEARRAGMVEEDFESAAVPQPSVKRNSMFVDDDDEEEQDDEQHGGSTAQQSSLSSLNPAASVFAPANAFAAKPPSDQQPKWMTSFGDDRSPSSPGGPPKGLFGLKEAEQSQPAAAPSAPAQSPFSTGLGATPSPFGQPASTAAATTSAPAVTSGFTGFNFGQPSTQPSLLSRISPAAPDEVPADAPTQPAPKSTNFHFTPDGKPLNAQAATDSTSQPTSQHTNFHFTPDGKPLNAEIPKSTPTFSWTTTPATKPELDTSKPPQPLFSLSLPSSSSSIPSTTSAPSLPSFNSQPATAQASKPFNFGFPSTTPAASQPSTQSATPSFSFSKPAAPATSASASTEPTSKPTPFAQIGSQPIGQYKFPSPEPASTTPAGSPIQPPSVRKDSPFSSFSASAQPSQPQNQTSTPASSGPFSAVAVEEDQPQQIDEEELLKQLCRIGLVQKDGILDMFVSYKIAGLVKEVFKTFQDQRFAKHTAALKESLLRRKFFALWKSRTDQLRLSKRAARRRGKLAASIKAANEKKRREEAESAELQEAQAFRKHMQEAQKKRHEEAERKQKEKQAQLQAQQALNPPSTNPAQKAGQKRKMLANSTSQSNIQGIAMSPMHKRSRTLGSSGDNEVLRASNSLPARSPRATLTGSTDLRRSISQKSLRQSISQQRLDQTQTDYFRLKAHGVDPDTPLIPETAAQVAARKQREEEHRQSVDDRVFKRSRSALDRSSSRSSTPSSPAQSARSMPPPTSVPRSTSTSQPSVQTTSAADEDPYLRQLREAREALSTDETWFKTHTSELEKEIEQQEEFRRSFGSQSNTSQDNSFTQSTNGFARSVSGYEYVPPELQPGQTLSRTEERIRRTGARGLANKPIGGTPRPVAMSRRTASQLQAAQNQNAVHGRKRSIDEVDHVNGYANVDYQQQPAAQLAQQVTVKKPRPNGVTMQAFEALQRSSPLNPFNGTGFDDECGDESGGTEEYEDDVLQEQEIHRQHYDEAIGYDEDDVAAAEGDYEDEDEEEEEEYSDNDEDQEQDPDIQYPDLQDYGVEYEDEEVDEQGNTLPPRGRSAATSTSTPDTGTGTGVGSTADAAIELSD
ncbi:actin cytoskeleton and mitosis protein [Knufia fluminis]|uniref:Actin cytoskeleton and mitosis protein n=1 Tax=Knufia fluminis TaxID=191047 RepID=A0AAN8I9T5_9EURO|nr:actin cytoskeleton and mitosis protein [Knufia fluminis]